MNALPLSHVSTELATPSLSASSGGENSCVMCLVDTIITGLEPFPPQPLRSYDEKGFPITIDSSSESLDYERRLVAGMFPADINKDKFIPLTRAESESYRRLVTGMF